MLKEKHFLIKRIGAVFGLCFFLFLLVCWEKIPFGLTTKYMQVSVMSNELSDDYSQAIEAEKEPSIRFNNHPIAYDSDEDVYYVSQNMYAGEWEGYFTADTGKLFWAEDEYWECFDKAIAEGHIFTLYHLNDKDKTLRSYRIVFSGMPIMTLSIEQYDESSEEYYGNVVITDPYTKGKEVYLSNCVYHVRGGSSRNYKKKSYKLELNESVSLLGMRKDDDWILNALYDDAGLIHNKFSIDVWRNIASDNSVANDEGVQAEYVELFIDNDYLGVYALTERIDKKELNLAQGSILYKCFSWEIPEKDSREEDFGFGKSFEIVYPDPYTQDMWDPLQQYTDLFCRKGNISMQEAAGILNIENAIDYNIFTLLAYGCDNLRKNTYYAAEPYYGGYIIKKIPWDMNATWGNAYVGDPSCNYTIYDSDTIRDTEMWCTDILKLYSCNEEQVRELLDTRWKELRQGILSEDSLRKQLDEEFEYLHASGGYERNYTRWKNGVQYWKDEYIYEYVNGRLQFLDLYFQQPYFDTIFIFNEDIF